MIELSTFCEKFTRILTANKLDEFASGELAEKFWRLTVRMLEVNEYMNLTAITDPDAVICKHYADSLTASAYIKEGASVIDVGCGAGFPSLPLAIARPDLRVTALDSTAKRVNYIRETAEILGLDNITCIAARAEDEAHNPALREKFDISCARAVARLNVLCELCIPYVKVGGQFVAMKANAEDELEEAKRAIPTLGGRLLRADHIELISGNGEEPNPRTIIVIEKISPSPKNYPRNNAQIKKKPL
ncbi:MAG: 16S rRNA (guanine(527)-N(7))-methyltransferase RsmG [Clostridia bacterium]|nr:16S rRNA (guanine(527)-N(7))-methyltransferase RsmG [Clostridia bacterium]